MSLPIFCCRWAERRWKVLATATTAQAALLLASGIQLQHAPWTLVGQWLSVAAYIRLGMYTVQELINGLHLDGTLLNLLIPLAVVALAFPCVLRLSRVRALALLSFVSAFWMYHGMYDFAVLLVPGVLLYTPSRRRDATEECDLDCFCRRILGYRCGAATGDP